MPVPSSVTDLDPVASNNSPAGSEPIGQNLDEYLRAHAAIIRQVSDASKVETQTHAATSKTTPVDADELPIADSAASFGLKKLTWANLKAGIFNAWGALIAAGTAKATPVDADAFAIMDSAASNATKTLTLANLKAVLKTYFDTIYGAISFSSTAENQAGTVTNKAVSPAGIREAFNASGSAPVYAARAFVNYNGTGTPAIRASGNVSSITDNGVGLHRLNFATAIQDANYTVAPASGTATVGQTSVSQASPFSATANGAAYQAGSFGIGTNYSGGALSDLDIVNLTVFR